MQQFSPFQNMASLVQSLNAGSRPGGPGYSGNPLQQLAMLQQQKAQQTGMPLMQLPGVNNVLGQENGIQGLQGLLQQLKSGQQSPGMGGGGGGIQEGGMAMSKLAGK